MTTSAFYVLSDEDERALVSEGERRRAQMTAFLAWYYAAHRERGGDVVPLRAQLRPDESPAGARRDVRSAAATLGLRATFLPAPPGAPTDEVLVELSPGDPVIDARPAHAPVRRSRRPARIHHPA
jgi:hypothetical protein